MTYRRRLLGATPRSKVGALWVVAVVAVVLVVWSPIGLETASAQRAGLDCPDNLLVNPGFENGFSGRVRSVEMVAEGWHPWYAKLPGVNDLNYPPEYTPRNKHLDGDNMVLSGLWSQEQATHGATHTAGLWQRVPVPSGSVLSAFVSAYAWATAGGNVRQSEPAGTYFMALGIDPRAGTDPEAAHIVWTRGITVTDLWVPLMLELPVHTSAVTVFTRGQPLRVLTHNVSRWDEACLRVIRPIEGPTATPTARRWPTRTQGPDEPAPTVTSSPTSDPATQASLDVGLALDMQATRDAASAPGGTEDAGSGEGWAEDAATPTPDAWDAPPDDQAPPRGGSSIVEWSGLLFLALGALAGGLVLGLSWRRTSVRVERDDQDDRDEQVGRDDQVDRDVPGAESVDAPEGEPSP